MIATDWSWHPLGDSALQFTLQANPELPEQAVIATVSQLREAIAEQPFVGYLDAVAAFGSLAVYFDLQTVGSQTALQPSEYITRHVLRLVKSLPFHYNRIDREIEIPICFDFALDLEECSAHLGVSPKRWKTRFCELEFMVGAIGFAPGFPYMLGLPESMQMPRLPTPRLRLPAGSVAIGGPYCGVYPQVSPGGWRVVGRTPLRLFEQQDVNSPCLLAVGDRVRFYPVTPYRFERMEREGT